MRKVIKHIGRNPLCQWLAAGLIAAYMLLVWHSSRKVVKGTLPQGQKVIALWHGRLALATFFDRTHWPLYSFSSPHPDSLMITKAARLHGMKAVYGSTREGALSGFRQALRAASRGASLLFTPDGPTGPRMHAQPGVAEFARMTGLAVLPVSFSAKNCIHLKTWDKSMLPLPFTTLVLVYGKPLQLAKQNKAAGTQQFIATLTTRLIEVQNEADGLAGQPLISQATPAEVAAREARYAWKTRKPGAAR
jgi:lysophospholipid acyltransferase (LPLAT)-like uncharacterized protein